MRYSDTQLEEHLDLFLTRFEQEELAKFDHNDPSMTDFQLWKAQVKAAREKLEIRLFSEVDNIVRDVFDALTAGDFEDSEQVRDLMQARELELAPGIPALGELCKKAG